MTDHAQIEELLAGYALRSLSGADADEANRLLSEHVPTCDSCRRTLHAFGAVAADLALAAPPAQPPETLLPRLHRSLGARPGRTARAFPGRPGRIVAAAASIVLVVGAGGLALTRGGSAPPLLVASDLAEAASLAARADARTTDLGEAVEVEVPGMDSVILYGRGVPQPPAGSVYRLWMLSGDRATYVGEFRPDPDGSVALRIDVDPAAFEHLAVTVEPQDSTPSEPGEPAWKPAA